MQVVIRSDSHKKKNEYMEKYSYLITKHTAQKKCMCKNFFLRPQADRFVRLFVGRLRWIQQDARTSSVVFTFIDIFHWKFCRQNYSTGQIKVKQGVTLSVWIFYIIVWRFFRLHCFYPFLVISIVSDSSFVSLLSVAVWRSFTNDHRVILRDRRKHVKIYSDNKIAVPLSVFVSRSLIYTLGT